MKVRTLCFSSCFKYYTFISSFYMNYNVQHTWIFLPLFILKNPLLSLLCSFWCRQICCNKIYLSVLSLPATSVTPRTSCRESITLSTSLESLIGKTKLPFLQSGINKFQILLMQLKMANGMLVRILNCKIKLTKRYPEN